MRLRRALVAALLAGCTSTAQPPSDATADAPPTDASYDAPETDRSDANDLLTPRFEAWETGAPSPLCNGAGWCWESPSPAGGEVVSISSSETDDGWALTTDGMLLHAWGGRLEAMRVHPYDVTLGRGRRVERRRPTTCGSRRAMRSFTGTARRMQRVTFYDGFNEPDARVGARAARHLALGGPQGDVLHFDGTRWTRRALPSAW